MLESGKNNRKILIIAGICLVVLAIIFVAIYGVFMPRGQAGEKTIGLTVVFSQDNQKEYKIHTDAENLGDALKEEKLVDGTQGEYGLYIETVDGVTADASKSGMVVYHQRRRDTQYQRGLDTDCRWGTL